MRCEASEDSNAPSRHLVLVVDADAAARHALQTFSVDFEEVDPVVERGPVAT